MTSSVNYTTAYNALQLHYQELPWYKKIGLWLTAPMLAWDLFGSHQSPTINRINQFITWANASWFFQGAFGDTSNVCATTQYAKEVDEKIFPVPCGVVEFAGNGTHFSSMNLWHRSVTKVPRNYKITETLLLAVAYGMESEESNIPVGDGYKDSSNKPLFKPLYAKNLLVKSPEFLLERAYLTDWAGRTFKRRKSETHPEGAGITAFEYALWAKDFKMLEMMLSCIPATAEGDTIRAGLLEQYEQVKATISDGGGLTYELTYDRPIQGPNGIPLKDAAGGWQTSSVTETHTENHFDLNPLIHAYQDYDTHFDARTWPQHDACREKVIRTLQRLLPIHILQRYCDPDIPFYPLPSFTGNFKRRAVFYNYSHAEAAGLEAFLFSGGRRFGRHVMAGGSRAPFDLVAVRQIDEVSTNEIEKIKRLLTAPGESSTQFRR